MTEPPLGDELLPFLVVLRAAFPATPTGEHRRALLAVLFNDMSEEGLSKLGADFFGDEPVIILDEAIHAATDRPVAETLKDEAHRRLELQGWPFGRD